MVLSMARFLVLTFSYHLMTSYLLVTWHLYYVLICSTFCQSGLCFCSLHTCWYSSYVSVIHPVAPPSSPAFRLTRSFSLSHICLWSYHSFVKQLKSYYCFVHILPLSNSMLSLKHGCLSPSIFTNKVFPTCHWVYWKDRDSHGGEVPRHIPIHKSISSHLLPSLVDLELITVEISLDCPLLLCNMFIFLQILTLHTSIISLSPT